MNTHIETLVIGAGQAGLSTAYLLGRSGRECLVLDGSERIGDNWRQQWDSLRLYTPAKYDGLPGMAFPADDWEYPTKDQTADFLESYAEQFGLPVQLRTRVSRVSTSGTGYLVETDTGSYDADNVVVATGTFGREPFVPAPAAELDPGIVQLHSSQYRRPSQLQGGAVLVVGASHSGFDIAYELAAKQHTILAGRDCGEIPLRIEGFSGRVLLPTMWFVGGHLLNRRTPMGRKQMANIRFHGGPSLRVKRSDLATQGVERIEERVVGADHGMPVLTSGRVLEVANVVWATGFRQSFEWIDVPVFEETGWPREQRGVVAEAPGLYFTGLSFQSSFRSMLIGGAGADAEHVVNHILARTRQGVAA